MSGGGTDTSEAAHGLGAWPFGGPDGDALPDLAPDGSAWPRVRILVLDGDGDAQATHASIERQAYPYSIVGPVLGSLGQALQEAAGDYLLAIRAGDLLTPGALASLCCEAVLSGADVVSGIIVHYGPGGVTGLDAVTNPGGSFDRARGRQTAVVDEDFDLFGSGAMLVCRRILIDSERLTENNEHSVSHLRQHLARGARFAQVGRPVVLRPEPAGPVAAVQPSRRIAILTDRGFGGGAGIAQRRIAEALALAGHAIEPIRLDAESPPAAAEWRQTFPAAEAAAARCDLVLAGNLHGVTRSTDILGRLAQERPVAAILHDLFALTGRCAHPKDCRLVESGCDRGCPTPDEFPQLDPKRIAGMHAHKRAVLAAPQSPLLLAASDWAAARARDWSPDPSRVERIRLAFPTGVFRPGPRRELRRRLGLPQDATLIVFGAVIADAPDKGFADLMEALRSVAGPEVGFVALGRLDDPDTLGLPNLYAPGSIGDEEELSAYYAACDIHITASRLETFGQTPIEAGLCGVPTVAYRATGLTSSVIDGVTGILVEPGAGGLGDALAGLIADEPRRRRLGATARLVFESRHSHAAAALSLESVLIRHGMLPDRGPILRFAPGMLGHFAFAEKRHRGAIGTVSRDSGVAVRRLRRLKQAVLGRGMPLWLRRAVYAAALLRGALNRARTGADRS